MRRLAAVLAAAVVLAGCGSSAPHAHLWVTPTVSPRTVGACLSADCGPWSVALDWTIPAFPGQDGYWLYLNGSKVGSASSSPFEFTGSDCGATNTLGVEAHDSAGDHGPLWTTSYTAPMCVGAPAQMALYSQGDPTYSTGTAVNSVSNMVDASYDSFRCTPPCSGIVDISGTAASERAKSLITWYNNANDFDHVDNNFGGPYNLPLDFTIDANSAAGGGSPPTTGWVTLETGTNNKFNAGQYDVDLSAYNWVRMDVSQSAGTTENEDAAWHLDITGCTISCTTADDAWLMLGDSITNNSMQIQPTSPPNFMQTVNQGAPAFYPSGVNAGLSGWQAATLLGTDSATGEPFITEFLDDFPAARYVTLNFGTNDLNGSGSNYADTATSDFEANMTSLVQDVIDAGRIPVVPTVPWAPAACDSSGALGDDNPATSGTPNYWIVHTLYSEFPQIVHGPDLWTYFDDNQSLIDTSNCPHPTTTGQNDYRTLWADTMLTAVYGG